MQASRSFFDPRAHGFVRLAVAVPRGRVAEPAFNADETVQLLRQAAAQGAALVAFPELGLSSYTCEDLFQQEPLLAAAEEALETVRAASADIACIAVVGLPLRVDQRLFNCAAVISAGRVLGIVPKTYLPNYGEFYEGRQFSPAGSAVSDSVLFRGEAVPFGAQLIFEVEDGHGGPGFGFHVEICEDLWTPIPPSTHAALAGATVLVNLSASNITIGKSHYRRQLAAVQSARCLAAYLYTSAGLGESTTDLGWDGQSLIYENGDLLAESPRFSAEPHLTLADVDVQRLAHERQRQGSFGQAVGLHRAALATMRTVPVASCMPATPAPATHARPLLRPLERFPYVPADAARRDERCMEVCNIQAHALVQRLRTSGIAKVVIGVSGGLDSTHALLICARAMDLLGLPRSHILGFTMPGFATSGRTLKQAHALMQAIGCTAREIDIRPSCLQMLKDLGHAAAQGEALYDITFENVQAGERTSHLFRLANHHGALVVGTGDLSELALGWCTYGVGDHMSHYNVNASVPKTLIKHLVRWVADTAPAGAPERRVLADVLATEISPELVPGGGMAKHIDSDADRESDVPGQSTESTLGPYELHDFSLYHILRFGFAPSKVAFLAWTAWRDAASGAWPDSPLVPRNAYTLAEIKRHLHTFVFRFFQTSQFKRSCVPNAPKVGSGGSLSPRGDWRAPSDAHADVWLADLARVPDREARP